MWQLSYDLNFPIRGWVYSKPLEVRWDNGSVENVRLCHFFPVKPTKKQLRQVRKNKIH
ncbi:MULTISPECIES: DUF7279 family protein [Enterobacteriaceae]|uniref:Uncharacterized protein n=1 Tax=Enterobacter hormaechei subsp. steigerwaltii TaxID=299766 RepID=A0AAE4J6U3_9ENTR|nr:MULTISPECIES: hypothetical protein [Enterobacteriaceae]MDS0021835.1 hypothetical protein [Enterobacter hormaechei subsp. steigerwaltii]MDS0108909.1 hypothetical protein [Enterobacter hormaechei subsp. steigerwaltii]MDX7501436.1 hypothetical protein [Citrobacter freundii]